MNYTIKVNKLKEPKGNLEGFAQVIFGGSMKITNIAILRNEGTNQNYISMPRYKSNEKDEQGQAVYKDICNPITKEFRAELYNSILQEFGQLTDEKRQNYVDFKNLEVEMPAFRAVVTPFEREASNIRGLGRIYLEDVFVINNVSVLQGKESMFVAMPSYKTNQKDQQGKDIYQDICYPVTREFRSVMYGEVVNAYEVAKEKVEEKKEDVVGDREKEYDRDGFQEVEERELPFR